MGNLFKSNLEFCRKIEKFLFCGIYINVGKYTLQRNKWMISSSLMECAIVMTEWEDVGQDKWTERQGEGVSWRDKWTAQRSKWASPRNEWLSQRSKDYLWRIDGMRIEWNGKGVSWNGEKVLWHGEWCARHGKRVAWHGERVTRHGKKMLWHSEETCWHRNKPLDTARI